MGGVAIEALLANLQRLLYEFSVMIGELRFLVSVRRRD